jgi:hypothetical protein
VTNTVFEVCVDPKCGHKFCSNCLHDMFTHQGKRQFACKKCTAQGRQVMIKREKLSAKSLAETEVEKDVRVRRKVMAIYNKQKEAFETIEEFRNYEEEVEDIIYNLVNNINTEKTQQIIKLYANRNEESIAYNAGKRSELDQVLDKQIQIQNENLLRKIQQNRISEEEEIRYKKEHKRQVNELMLGERDTLQVTKGMKIGALDTPASASASDIIGNNTQLNQQSLFMLLNPRELPKIVKINTYDNAVIRRMSKDDRRLMHTASGYTHNEWFNKTWKEIKDTIGEGNVNQKEWNI